jgi:hypothetical protein
MKIILNNTEIELSQEQIDEIVKNNKKEETIKFEIKSIF